MKSAGRIVAALALSATAVLILMAAVRVSALMVAAQRGVASQPVELSERPPSLSSVNWEGDRPEVWMDLGPAYQGAWNAWNDALGSGDTDYLDRYFSGSALRGLEKTIRTGEATVHQTDGPHRLSLRYAHPRGWLVVFQDQGLTVDRRTGEFAHRSVESYQVIMVQDQGRWLVRNLTRVGGT